jgi:hypothetical protein
MLTSQVQPTLQRMEKQHPRASISTYKNIYSDDYEEGFITLRHIKSQEQQADLCTNQSPKEPFERNRDSSNVNAN